MHFEELQRKLLTWDNVMEKALSTCDKEEKKDITKATINIKKMELLNMYMIEACTDSHLLTAIEQFSLLVLDSVSELIKMYRKR